MQYIPLSLLLALGLFSTALIAGGNCNVTSTGLIPLTDLGTGNYQGFEGGLYAGGSNLRPAAHDAAGLAIASQIVPLDAAGNPAANGKIVMASLGYSNTTQASSALTVALAAETGLRAEFQFVNAAQAGRGAIQWADPNDSTWATFESRLLGAGVTGAQLQTVWMQISLRPSDIPTGQQAFPASEIYVQGLLQEIVLNLKSKYPSVKMVHLSSRIYGGYETISSRAEPVPYQKAFSVKWLIQDQISGATALDYTGANPPAPWLSWAAYMWADGLGPDNVAGGVGGRSDGLEWVCDDIQADGRHPSDPQGRDKMAALLLQWMKADATVAPWFLASGGEPDIGMRDPANADVPNGGSIGAGDRTTGVASGFSLVIENRGALDLLISGPVVLSGLSNCTVDIVTQPAATVAGGSIATPGVTGLVLEITPTLDGSFSFSLSIASNDPDENPFIVAVSGVGAGAGANPDADDSSDGGAGCTIGGGGLLRYGAILALMMLTIYLTRRRRPARE